jgi:hypothetical protein
MPFDRLAAGRRVINAGSVGLPYGHQGASWAMLGPDVTLRRTRYDAGAAAAVLWSVARDLPGIEGFTGNVRTPASDEEALKAFTVSVRLQTRER